jgi:hypothetical protein
MIKDELDDPEDLEANEAYESPEEEGAEQLAEKLQAFGFGLQRLAQEQVGIRQVIEDRWLADLEQYMGQYDAETKGRLAKSSGSQAFVNITRSKTTVAEARLSDMLFPSDDKNWGIQPTPVPELERLASIGLSQYDRNGVPVSASVMYSPDDIARSGWAKRQLDEARKRAEAMAKEIDDQLVEAKYHQVARDVIHDACLFGTGIIKGPVIINRTRKMWQQVAGAVHQLQVVNEFRPGVEHVKIWDFFPDMSASKIEECAFIFERRYVTKKQLIELAKRPGYLTDQIRQVIAESPRMVASVGGTYIARMRELSGLQANLDDHRYELWEYHGPVEKDNLRMCGCEVDDDELTEIEAVVAFINGRVIKADLNPLETNESPYSTFCFEDDDTSVFGVGVPYLLRNEQKIVNAAWRMTLDNAALSTGPQIVVNRELVVPSDNAWDLKAKKVWWLLDPEKDVRAVFDAFEINSHQAELTDIFDRARELADEVTSLPMLAQGEQGEAPDTLGGTSILMNAANVVLRRVVKQFDDGITRPFIGRMYDWNMQNSEKEEIKGDFEVDARGSSALMVKETQTQALQNLLMIAEREPYKDLTKHAALYRKTVEAQHLNADDIVKTDKELEADGQDPTKQTQEQLLQLQVQELQAKIDKMIAETFEKNMKGLYESMQSGQVVMSMPPVAPVADELSKSAGFKDHNGYPVAGNVPQAPVDGMPIDEPLSPAVGYGRGIETMRNDGVRQ